MLKNQRGDEIVGLMAVIVSAIVAYLAVSHHNNASLFNRWAEDCRKVHGVVSVVDRGTFTSSYECFVDGKITTLPGYEQYSTGIKN